MAEKGKEAGRRASRGEKTRCQSRAAPARRARRQGGGGRGILTKTPVLLGGAMLIEAVVLFAGFKFITGGAKNANAADLTTPVKKEDGADGDKSAATDSSTHRRNPVARIAVPQQTQRQDIPLRHQDLSFGEERIADKVKAIIAATTMP